MITSMIGALLMGASCCLIGTRWTYGIVIAGSLIAAAITRFCQRYCDSDRRQGRAWSCGRPAARSLRFRPLENACLAKHKPSQWHWLTIPILGATFLASRSIAHVGSEFGWRSVFFITVGVCFFGLLLWGALALWAWLAPYAVVPGERIADGFGALAKWQSWAYVGARLLVDPLYTFLIFWAPQCMMRTSGWSVAETVNYHVVCGIAGMAGRLVWADLRRTSPP